MEKLEQTVCLDEEVLLHGVVEILDEMTSEWDKDFTGEISPDTWLVNDLGCESIDFVMLIVAIEGRFKQQGLPFEKLLMKDGQYIKDLRVAEVVDFLRENLQS